VTIFPDSRRVAVVHDWLTGMRGGEKVLEAILELFPTADLFTLFHERGAVSAAIESHRIVVSSIDKLRPLVGDYRRLLPLLPRAVEQWDFRGYDLVVSSSHCVAKGVKVPRGVPHLCYCHTPMRYIWDRFDDYFPKRRPLMRAAALAVTPALRRWDVDSARRVTRFVANSKFVAARIERLYGREAAVVHPFVDEAFLATRPATARSEEHLIVSALVPYKRVDLAIEAARMAGKRLTVIGSGPLLDRLRNSAPPGVEFLGWSGRDALISRLRTAQSLILPGVEDFGITPLEAMAVGTPVIAYRDGGALETVQEEVTGVFFDSMSPEAVAAAMQQVERKSWDRAVLNTHAARFNRERFKSELIAEIERAVESIE
jgi:glycosyltransferase involved in cell wall biosynthesis